jgi:hypothetical protein
VTVAEHWLVCPVFTLFGLQDTETERIVGDVMLPPPPPPQADIKKQRTATDRE